MGGDHRGVRAVGGSHERFCSKRGLQLASFRSWLYRLRRSAGSATEVALVPVTVTAGPLPLAGPARGEASATVVVAVAGVEVRVAVGADVGYVAALVAELGARC